MAIKKEAVYCTVLTARKLEENLIMKTSRQNDSSDEINVEQTTGSDKGTERNTISCRFKTKHLPQQE